VIALLIHGLMALTLAVGYRFYVAGLAALSGPGRVVTWLAMPGEAAVVLLAGLAVGGWLAGVALGERLRHARSPVILLAVLLALPITLGLIGTLRDEASVTRFALAGQSADTVWLLALGAAAVSLVLGGLAGAWWASLAPPPDTDEEGSSGQDDA
jgi:hypothetical protein